MMMSSVVFCRAVNWASRASEREQSSTKASWTRAEVSRRSWLVWSLDESSIVFHWIQSGGPVRLLLLVVAVVGAMAGVAVAAGSVWDASMVAL